MSNIPPDRQSVTGGQGLNGAQVVETGPLPWTTFYNTINGKLETTAETRCSINPATEENNPQVPLSTKDEVERAMIAASAAFKSWSIIPYTERQRLVLAFADALVAEKEPFAKLLTQEQGKPIHFARLELDAAVAWMQANASHELPTEETEDGDKITVIRYTPLGVAVGLVPWNFPILLAAGKISAAVVTGNTIIIKPSPFTPAGDLKLCELAQKFFPPGVVQCLSGDENLGVLLTEHPTPAKISFTGSTATGKKVMASASKTLKRVTLELGGKDPAIILEDVDLEDLVPKVATFAFLNSGQICLNIKRIFVHEKILDEFRAALIKHVKTLKMAEGNEPDTFLGPVQNSMQFEKVKTFFDDIEKDQLKVAVGGKISSENGKKGYFITPTIIDSPPENSRIVTEEPFGPIVPLLSFATDDEAIEKANNTIYGLGASIWSRNIQRANEMAKRIEAGTVWVNAHFEMDPRMPFGGHKQSGIGIEQGVGGLKAFCNTQVLYLKKAE